MGRSKSLGPAAILPAKMMLPDAARSPLSIVAGGPRESPAGSTEDGGPFRSRGTARGYSRNRRLALMLTLLVPLAQLAVISWLIRDHTSDVPNSDEWAMVRLVRATREGHLGLEDFWAFHNTHRVVVPRLTTLALIEITHWHRQILMGFNVAIAVVTGLFLLAAARVTFRSTTFTWLFIVPLSLLILSMSRYHNWTKPFTDKMWTAFGVALCLWALVVLRRDSTSLATAVSGAFIASLSSIGGFATWIAFLPAVWLRGWRSVAVWVTSAIALIVPYIMDFPANEGTISLNQAPSVGLAFLGAPLGQRDESTAIVAASLSILTSLVLLTGLRLLPPAARNEKQTRATAAWVGLALFALGSGAMIAGGGREGALSSRYHAFSVYWWVALVVVAMLVASCWAGVLRLANDERRTLIGRSFVVLGTLTAVLVVAASIASNLQSAEIAAERQAEEQENEGCVLAYRFASNDCLSLFSTRPDAVRRNAEFLDQQRMAIFRSRPALDPTALPTIDASIPAGIASVSTDSSRRGRGVIDRVDSGTPITVSAWAGVGRDDPAVGAVLVVIDGANYLVARADASAATRSRDDSRVARFIATIPPETLLTGRHTLEIRVANPDFTGIYESSLQGNEISIDVQ